MGEPTPEGETLALFPLQETGSPLAYAYFQDTFLFYKVKIGPKDKLPYPTRLAMTVQ